jgi:hypothetical protein
MTPLIVTLPAPETVAVNPPLLTVPPMVRVPASLARVEADPKVTAPAQELFPLILRRAPSLLIPEPFRARVSVPTAMPP